MYSLRKASRMRRLGRLAAPAAARGATAGPAFPKSGGGPSRLVRQPKDPRTAFRPPGTEVDRAIDS